MRYTSIRQVVTLMLLTLVTTSIYAQQRLTYYGPAGATHGGIFKDVQGTTTAAGLDVITAVGSDDVIPANGVLGYHTNACIPTAYTIFTNPAGNLVDAKALCDFGNNRVVACFFDPVAQASDVVFADLAGLVFWQTRLPNFHVKDVVTFVGPNQGKVWLTGFSTDPGLARATVVVGLNALAGGALIFHTKYVLGPNLINSEGFEIAHNPATGNLTVVGRVGINACTSGAFAMRLNAAGGWINGRYYFDAACNFDLIAKALVITPGTFNDYSIVMDYHQVGTGFTYPAYMQINPPLNIVAGTSFYSNAFGSNQMHVDGLDADGQHLLASGVYDVGAGPLGMTWNVDPAIPATIQFNEYSALGAYTPLFDQLVDLDYYPNTGLYYIGGNFVNNAAGGGAAWPIAPGNNAFWLIGANGNGNSDCNDYDLNLDVPIAPANVLMNLQVIQDVQVNCPLVAQPVVPGSFDQCVAKRHGTGSIQDQLPPAGLQFAYLPGQGQIQATIPAAVSRDLGEATGQVTLTLVDLQGRRLQSYSLTAGTHHLETPALSAGVYFLQYQGPGIPAGTQKIAIR